MYKKNWLQRLKRLRSYNSLSLTKLHPSCVSDNQDTTKLQQRAQNTQQSLSQLCINNTCNIPTFFHICLWQRKHDVEFDSSIISFFGICPHSSPDYFLGTAEAITDRAYSFLLANSPYFNISFHFH